MQTAEMIRVQLMMTPPQVAIIDALRRAAEGRVPSRSQIIRSAIEEQAKRVLGDAPATQSSGTSRKHKGKS